MRQQGSRRPGVSLIEVTVAGAIGATVLGLAVAVLHTFLRADRAERGHVQQTTQLAQLARLFRDDVRSATGGSTDGAAAEGATAQLTLRLPDDRRVVYRREKASLVREVTRGDKLVQRESFPLNDNASRLEVSGDDAARRATLTIERPPDSDPKTLIRIRSAIGGSRAHARPAS